MVVVLCVCVEGGGAGRYWEMKIIGWRNHKIQKNLECLRMLEGHCSTAKSMNLLLTWHGSYRILPLGNVPTFWIIGPREGSIARGASSPTAEQTKREDDEAQAQSHCRHRDFYYLCRGQPRCPVLTDGLRSPNVLHHAGVGIPERGGCG